MVNVSAETALLCLVLEDAKFKINADIAPAVSKKPNGDLPLILPLQKVVISVKKWIFVFLTY